MYAQHAATRVSSQQRYQTPRINGLMPKQDNRAWPAASCEQACLHGKRFHPSDIQDRRQWPWTVFAN